MNEGFSVFHNFPWLLGEWPKLPEIRGAWILRGPVNNYSRILLYNNVTSGCGGRGGGCVKRSSEQTNQIFEKSFPHINSDYKAAFSELNVAALGGCRRRWPAVRPSSLISELDERKRLKCFSYFPFHIVCWLIRSYISGWTFRGLFMFYSKLTG